MIDFEKMRFDETHHLGLGDVRLTIGQQQELEEENAELLKDRERLEWLAENEYAPSVQGVLFSEVAGPFSHAENWRDAIDAVMGGDQ